MKNNAEYDIVVVGGGPAGLAAAIEARSSGVQNVLVIERDRELGGILQQCIHNGFGLHLFKKDLTGPEYAELFVMQLKELGIDYKLDTMVLSIDADKIVKAVNPKEGVLSIQAKAIILAMGCRERTRGALNIPGSRPAGVFTAGTAQRLVNIEGYMVGKRVMILGSGDIGLIMARRLTLEGAKVEAVVEVMPYPGGLTRNIVQCLDDFGIPLMLSHTVVNVCGKERLTGVHIAKVDAMRNPVPGTEHYIACDTMLLSVGLIPENELSANCGIILDPITQGPLVDDSLETSVKGIFACGNVLHVHDLVDFVTEESRKAGRCAAHSVNSAATTAGHRIKTVASKNIRYVVPQIVNLDSAGDELEFFLRSQDVYDNASLIVSMDGKPIKTIKKQRVLPGEMQHFKLNRKMLSMDSPDAALSVSLE